MAPVVSPLKEYPGVQGIERAADLFDPSEE
jgi:hypothetical protein